MPRHHTISYPRQWVVETELEPAHWQESYQEDVLFTTEEEVARDAEEVIDRVRIIDQIQIDERHGVLRAKLADDSITFSELKELMRLKG